MLTVRGSLEPVMKAPKEFRLLEKLWNPFAAIIDVSRQFRRLVVVVQGDGPN